MSLVTTVLRQKVKMSALALFYKVKTENLSTDLHIS